MAVLAALGSANVAQAGEWLPQTHTLRYGTESVPSPFGPLLATAQAATAQDIAEYLAIAAPTHCADGWAYLARAVSAYLSGDAHSSWHLAYYAELRAAQSVLSALGCGSFNKWNCILDTAGSLVDLGGGQTHQMVWAALSTLSEKSNTACANISDSIQLFGTSLPSIISAAFPGTPVVSTAAAWVTEWLFDLDDSHDDKVFRNRCSYSPHEVTDHRASCGEAVEMISLLWKMLEPSPGAPFFEVDRVLLRSALRTEAAAAHARIVAGGAASPPSFEAVLKDGYDRMVATLPQAQCLPLKYFIQASLPADALIAHAKNHAKAPDTPRPVLARSFLLLRLATGLASKLVVDACKQSHIRSWLDKLAIQCGVVAGTDELPDPRAELFADAMTAVDDAAKVSETAGDSLATFLRDSRTDLHRLANFERVLQWGMG